jgi:hypothetical protein
MLIRSSVPACYLRAVVMFITALHWGVPARYLRAVVMFITAAHFLKRKRKRGSPQTFGWSDLKCELCLCVHTQTYAI